jgi:hypothetical protein
VRGVPAAGTAGTSFLSLTGISHTKLLICYNQCEILAEVDLLLTGL